MGAAFAPAEREAARIIRGEHASLAAVLRSLEMMLSQSGAEPPERFFDVVRAMLFYIDEFPEKRHHPKESDLLFPRLAQADPSLMGVIRRLESDHLIGEDRVRELQHLLLAWELLGDSRKTAFEQAARDYARFYLEHMKVEETVLLPAAAKLLSSEDWDRLDEAFQRDLDPLTGGAHEAIYDRLFTRIVMAAPAPIGVGPDLKKVRAA